MWVFGILALLAGGGLWYAYTVQKRRLALLQSTETATVAHLQELTASMADGVGAGSLLYRTEVKGKVRCDAPLRSELAEQPCIYYTMQVTHEYEETYYERDQQGRNVQRTRHGTETVASNTRFVPFMVEDSTGQIPIVPEGASFIAETVLSRFVPQEELHGGTLRMGQWTGQAPGIRSSDRQTLGYRYEEEAIALGRDIYVLGEATDREGKLCIMRPHDQSDLLISVKGEEQLAREGSNTMTLCLIGAMVCELLGMGLLIAELWQK